MNEAINGSSKLIAQAIEALKYCPTEEEKETWNYEGNIQEVIEMLKEALVKLTDKM